MASTTGDPRNAVETTAYQIALRWQPAIAAVHHFSVVKSQDEKPSRPRLLPSDADCGSSFSLTDLGLVHHFTLHAAATLPINDDPDYYLVWTRDVPALAVSHACLSHALLAFSGAHRAYHSSDLKSSASDNQLARQHYGHALGTFRTTVTNLDDEHKDVLLPFCVLTCFVTIRMELDDHDSPTSAIGVFINLLRTVRLSVAELSVSLNSIDLLIQEDPNHKTLWQASAGLRSFFTKVQPHPDSWAMMLQWLVGLQSEFSDLLRARDKIALCLLAHWCVPLFHAPDRWFTHGWPRNLVQEIAAYLSELGWEAYIQWPLRETLFSDRVRGSM
ncbi:hypothetical protein MRB53_041313 [Persea americana]|nr:hypothetical protein MRB53_041313 [Persea americana]